MTRPTEPDLYAVLGVEPDATAEAIKQAYRRKVLELHPDHNPDRPEAAARLQAATDAFEVLKDEGRRRAYDARRADNPSRRQWAEQVLGKQRPERGADLKFRLALDLEEVATGTTRTVAVDRAELCDACSGTGGRPGTTPEPCRTCSGKGSTGGWMLGRRCTDCRGTGRRFAQPCPVCAGRGRIRTKRRIQVRVPPAVESGTRLRVAKEGDVGIDGGPRGDLFVVVEVRPHPLFERRGLDVVVEAPVTLSEAVLGADVKVPTLQGATTLRLDPGTPSGTPVRLSRGGLADEKGRVGDLEVRWTIEMPAALTSAQRKLFEELRRLEREAPPSVRLQRWRERLAERTGRDDRGPDRQS